ncbi:hypothetical protein D3C80_1568760 [compost metagenome]
MVPVKNVKLRVIGEGAQHGVRIDGDMEMVRHINLRDKLVIKNKGVFIVDMISYAGSDEILFYVRTTNL